MIWGFPGFPEIGVPPIIIHLNGIFMYLPLQTIQLWGSPNFWKPPFGWRVFESKVTRPKSFLILQGVVAITLLQYPHAHITYHIIISFGFISYSGWFFAGIDLITRSILSIELQPSFLEAPCKKLQH